MNPLNIILFGETGVGKSSVINLIAGRELAKTSPDVQGCTMSFKDYAFPRNGRSFFIWDTVGLEEPELGVNGFLPAIEQAWRLIHHLQSHGGVDLLLFCIRGDCVTTTSQSNYRLFYEVFCRSQVPIALVITHLEREEYMESWWDRNSESLERYGIRAAAHACVTGLRSHRKYEESRKNIDKMWNGVNVQGRFVMPPEGWFKEFLRAFGLFTSPKARPKQKDVVQVLERRCKMDRKTAEELAKENLSAYDHFVWRSSPTISLEGGDLWRKLIRRFGFSDEDAELSPQRIEQTIKMAGKPEKDKSWLSDCESESSSLVSTLVVLPTSAANHSDISPHKPDSGTALGAPVAGVSGRDRAERKTRNDLLFGETGSQKDHLIKISTPEVLHLSAANYYSKIPPGKPDSGTALGASVPGVSGCDRAERKTLNVVLFGETGSQKDHLINLLAHKDLTGALSSDVTTMQTVRHDITLPNMDLVIFDVPGLEEPRLAVNEYFKALEGSYNLILQLRRAGGIHLLLFCMRGGRMKTTTPSNYWLFGRCFCESKVPTAFLFTGNEKEEKMQRWWETKRSQIEDGSVKSRGYACIPERWGDDLGGYTECKGSEKKVYELVDKCALKGPAFLAAEDVWLSWVGKGLLRFIEGERRPKREDIIQALVDRCKVDVATAGRTVDLIRLTVIPNDSESSIPLPIIVPYTS